MTGAAGAKNDLIPKVPARNSDLVLDGEFLRDIHGNEDPIYLNGSAAMIWGLCDGSSTVGEIVEMVEQAYADDDSGSVRSDVFDALAEMADKGIVRLSDIDAETKS
jgi:hypothetical protein